MGNVLINWLIVRASEVHLYLLVLDAFATWVVVKGILWETKGPPSVQKVAHHLVIWGVAAETLIILGLFWFDERISDGQKSQIEVQQSAIVQQGETILLQQDQIIGLEKANEALSAKEQETEATAAKTLKRAAQYEKEAAEAKLALERLKQPRTLRPVRQQFVSDAVRLFAGQRYRVAISQAADDGPPFWESLYVTLTAAGWVYLPPGTNAFTIGQPPAGVPIAASPGIEIVFDPAKEAELTPAALALGNALHADGTVVAVSRDNHSNPVEAERDILLIRIGARVPPE